jgi:hypothetical protein
MQVKYFVNQRDVNFIHRHCSKTRDTHDNNQNFNKALRLDEKICKETPSQIHEGPNYAEIDSLIKLHT